MMREVIRMHSEPSERHRARQRTELLLGAPEQSVAISRNQSQSACSVLSSFWVRPSNQSQSVAISRNQHAAY